MKEKISAVYQIKNIMTGERYVGSSKDVKRRWRQHKSPSTWDIHPNSKLYKDFQKYGIENFMFAIIAPVEKEYLKQVEQEFINMLKPDYNDRRSNGRDVERQKAYKQTEKYKAKQKAYYQTEKGKTSARACSKKYNSQLCYYNGETMTLGALRHRFERAGIPHAIIEAKKYIIKGDK